MLDSGFDTENTTLRKKEPLSTLRKKNKMTIIDELDEQINHFNNNRQPT